MYITYRKKLNLHHSLFPDVELAPVTTQDFLIKGLNLHPSKNLSLIICFWCSTEIQFLEFNGKKQSLIMFYQPRQEFAIFVAAGVIW